MSTTQAVTSATVARSLRGKRVDVVGYVFTAVLLFSLLFTLAILAVLVGDQLQRGVPVFLERGGDFLTSPLSSRPDRAGVIQGIVGTAMLGVMVALLAFPVGILTAVYLEEYAPANAVTRFIDVNIRNLAGVPSVVYGLLGLAAFVGFFSALGVGNGRNVLSGGLTLAVLILPLVIITSAEAIRAVPNTIREAGYGIGASRWQVVRRLVLPSAAPGILTGTVLALSRALGETAPLILAGAVLGSFSTAGGIDDLFAGPYTALPMIVFDWARKPQEEFRALTSAAILVLLAVTILANAVAIFLRNRYDRTW
ncbi:MAG TPA: phosphate ABC transporter permease PstA [Candidatus Limnocylindrales bacterium]|nr:phosphate ABC transporter permease PstA [Candidatus Limnocylindrales bacterium]